MRVDVSNEYGSQPLVIGATHIALSDGGAAIKAGSDRVLTFSGNESFTIPPGAQAVSDPVELSVPPLSNVAVSLFLPEVTPTTTMHWDARQTALYRGGEQGRRSRHPAGFQNRISAVPEWNPGRRAGGRACDCHLRRLITDGDGLTFDANHRRPYLLAERLQAANGAPVAVLNEEHRARCSPIACERVARFDEDSSHPHADTMILTMESMMLATDRARTTTICASSAPR